MFIFELSLFHFEYCKVHMNKKKAECAPGDDESSLAGNVNLCPLSDRTTV